MVSECIAAWVCSQLASQAAWIASSQYSCCSPLVVTISERLHSRRKLSSISNSAPIDYCLWSPPTASPCVGWRGCPWCDREQICTCRSTAREWLGVTVWSAPWPTSLMTELSHSPLNMSLECPATLWITPTMKFPHPILSCKIVNSWLMEDHLCTRCRRSCLIPGCTLKWQRQGWGASCFLSSTWWVLPPLARMPPCAQPLGSKQCVHMSLLTRSATGASWFASILMCKKFHPFCYPQNVFSRPDLK